MRSKQRGPLARLDRLIGRLPIPTLGRWTPLIGLAGLMAATLAFALVFAFLLRGVVSTDFLAYGTIEPPSGATPNPEFAADPIAADSERITLLLLGVDTRPSEAGYRTLSDTIMIASIDPQTGHAGILSIPRDLLVELPGYGLGKINTAYVRGGGELAMQTVEYNLGIEVDHYVVVQFRAFTTLVDEVGGIRVDVPYEIYDEEFPAECDNRDCGYEPLYISAGLQHMDGETALKYARTRHGDSDFDRAGRQQQVIMALRDQVLSINALPRLIERAPALYSALADNIRTDLSLDEMIELATLAAGVQDANIRRAVLTDAEAPSRSDPQYGYVLVANEALVSALIRETLWLD